jgi:hypothetical protein
VALALGCVCSPELYHVKGSDALNTYAVQVGTSAANLNSGDAFILLTPEAVHLWTGEGEMTGDRAGCISITLSV